MSADEIRELLNREPFEPFRFHLTRGVTYDIEDPNSVALGEQRVFIAVPATDRFVFFPYFQITAIESIKNGHKPRRRRHRR